MIKYIQSAAGQIQSFCAHIGANPLLVQGAGGNISWKSGNVLWVKASGTCLSDAESSDIFVPVDLDHLNKSILNKEFSIAPILVGNSYMRPSIETLLHALMPHRIVLHIHPVEILAHLVRENPTKDFKRLIDESVKWVCVDYFMPGADLAEAVADKLALHPNIDIVFLKNHGIVIGGEDIESIEQTLTYLTTALKINITRPTIKSRQFTPKHSYLPTGYVLCDDIKINELATRTEFSTRLQSEWALYPDHVVFLGDSAVIAQKNDNINNLVNSTGNKPPFVFNIGVCVYENIKLSRAQKIQLRCYYEILARQSASTKLAALSDEQVTSLIKWDAEKYRNSISK